MYASPPPAHMSSRGTSSHGHHTAKPIRAPKNNVLVRSLGTVSSVARSSFSSRCLCHLLMMFLSYRKSNATHIGTRVRHDEPWHSCFGPSPELSSIRFRHTRSSRAGCTIFPSGLQTLGRDKHALAGGQGGSTTAHPFSRAVLPSLFGAIVPRDNAVCILPLRHRFDLPPTVITLAKQGHVDMSDL